MELVDKKLIFEHEIRELISLKQEGGYWDFKREWHHSKTDLLHDIICMANNLCNRDAYIIIGLDEEHDHQINDVTNDPNRRNTEHMVTFLRDKRFAGLVRPVVIVEQLLLDSKCIDVIVVHNSHSTPFFLVDSFEGIRANHIYVRLMDTNTPKDKTADINHIEALWRKRFHLDETPLDLFRYHLRQHTDWIPAPDTGMGYYYKYSPEYSFSYEPDNRAGREYYMLGQVDSTPYWYEITLRYHQTVIDQFMAIGLDGGRAMTIAPEMCYELLSLGISQFGYFIEGDLRYNLAKLFWIRDTTEPYCLQTFFELIPSFYSEHEYSRFLDYLRDHLNRYKELVQGFQQHPTLTYNSPQGDDLSYMKNDACGALAVMQLLKEFRGEQQ